MKFLSQGRLQSLWSGRIPRGKTQAKQMWYTHVIAEAVHASARKIYNQMQSEVSQVRARPILIQTSQCPRLKTDYTACPAAFPALPCPILLQVYSMLPYPILFYPILSYSRPCQATLLCNRKKSLLRQKRSAALVLVYSVLLYCLLSYLCCAILSYYILTFRGNFLVAPENVRDCFSLSILAYCVIYCLSCAILSYSIITRAKLVSERTSLRQKSSATLFLAYSILLRYLLSCLFVLFYVVLFFFFFFTPVPNLFPKGLPRCARSGLWLCSVPCLLHLFALFTFLRILCCRTILYSRRCQVFILASFLVAYRKCLRLFPCLIPGI